MDHSFSPNINKLNAVFELGFQQAAAGLRNPMLDSMKTMDRSNTNRDRLHSEWCKTYSRQLNTTNFYFSVMLMRF